MIKFIVPAIIIFLIVLFWEKISETIYKKFNIKMNYIIMTIVLIIFGTILSIIPTNQIWILFNENSNKLFIGGLSNRNLLGFKKEFLKLSEEIKNF